MQTVRFDSFSILCASYWTNRLHGGSERQNPSWLKAGTVVYRPIPERCTQYRTVCFGRLSKAQVTVAQADRRSSKSAERRDGRRRVDAAASRRRNAGSAMRERRKGVSEPGWCGGGGASAAGIADGWGTAGQRQGAWRCGNRIAGDGELLGDSRGKGHGDAAAGSPPHRRNTSDGTTPCQVNRSTSAVSRQPFAMTARTSS